MTTRRGMMCGGVEARTSNPGAGGSRGRSTRYRKVRKGLSEVMGFVRGGCLNSWIHRVVMLPELATCMPCWKSSCRRSVALSASSRNPFSCGPAAFPVAKNELFSGMARKGQPYAPGSVKSWARGACLGADSKPNCGRSFQAVSRVRMEGRITVIGRRHCGRQ